MATIDVALDIRLGQRVVPHPAHDDVQLRHGCKHQYLLASRIVACAMLQHCATNSQQVADAHDVHDEQLQHMYSRVGASCVGRPIWVGAVLAPLRRVRK